MPSRNSLKDFAEGGYYHLYNRGNNKRNIFHDDQDYVVFLSLLKRHLDVQPHFDRQLRPYPQLKNHISLLCYCLMPNHFHLLVLNKNSRGIEILMRSVATSYVAYYNKKYQRIGPLFQGRYKASLVDTDSYLQHISRYIHLNPHDYKSYKYSSYPAIEGDWTVNWLSIDELMTTFNGTKHEYLEFVADYKGYTDTLDEIKIQLADR